MSATNKVLSDQRAMANMLTKVLELLEIKSSNFTVKLSSDIFKNPDKELFRKIMCFILTTIGGFEDWLSLYGKPIIATIVEAQFRISIKEIVLQINKRWPTANLKPVNQSFLVAPQGIKIISFLLSLSKFTLIVLCERCGETYIPPSASELELFLKQEGNVDYEISKQKLENRFEQLQIERAQILEKEKKSHEKLMTFIQSTECKNPELQKLKKIEEIRSAVDKWSEDIAENIDTLLENVENLEVFNEQLFELIKQQGEFVEFSSTHLDGNEIMKELGLKSNAAVKMKGIELVEDGKLNFISLLKFFNVHLEEFKQNLNIPPLEQKNVSILQRLEKLRDFYENISKEREECLKILNTYEPLVKRYCESTEAENTLLSNPILKTIYECEKNKNYIINKKECEPVPLPNYDPPSAENLSKWIREVQTNNSSRALTSERKIKSLRSPSLGRKSPSVSKFNLFAKKSEQMNDRKRALFGLAPLVGLCMENRRATLASPQMARRERFRVHHIDEKRKPLKPMKALFTASSPLGESTRSFHSENMASFGEQSKVEAAEECISEFPTTTTSSIVSYNSPKCTSLTVEPVISTPELLEWDRTSSDSDDSSCQPATVPPPCASSDSDDSSCQPATVPPPCTLSNSDYSSCQPATLPPPCPSSDSDDSSCQPATLPPPCPSSDSDDSSCQPATLPPPCPSSDSDDSSCQPATLPPPCPSSDSDDSSCQPATVQPPCASFDHFQSSLNDSTQLLIAKFKKYKDQLNLSQ